jgi:hypothetical protein
MKRSPLKRNPAAIRDWVQASRKPLQRTKLKPIGPTGQAKLGEPVGPLSPGDWRREVWALCEGTCIMTGEVFSLNSPNWDAHHCLPKQKLAPEYKYDIRNGVVLSRQAHNRHELRFEVVPFEKLPTYCIEFASELGSWAVEALLRAHPKEIT